MLEGRLGRRALVVLSLPGEVLLVSLSRAAFISAVVQGRSSSGLGWPWYSFSTCQTRGDATGKLVSNLN